MPKWMRHYLRARTLHEHLLICIISGFFLRTLSAYFVYGPQALDDYKHGVWPAYQFFAGLPLDLPDYRSHLLIWLLAFFLKLGSWVGVQSALAQARTICFFLGLLSLSGIYGTYLFVSNFRSRLFAPLALYLTALFPVMPFVSTRAFGESVALGFVLLAFGILEKARHEEARLGRWILGFAVLGFATLLRFHVGLLFVGYALVLLFLREWPGVFGALTGGILTLVGEFVIDALSAKPPFGTLLAYLGENEGGAAKYGASPWFNTWLFVLAVSLAPFSFVFIGKLPALWRRHWPWLAPFLFFVTAHSLVPHKEERFLYPVLGLELWALAYLWASSAFLPVARKVYANAVFILGLPLLLIVCFVNTQEGEIEPAAYAESHYHHVVYLDHQSLFGASRFQFYFLRPPSILREVSKEEFNANHIDEALNADPAARAVILITSVSEVRDQLHALEGIKTMESQCLGTRTAGSRIDRLLYALNPKHNERRRPTWYLICERTSAG